MMKEESCLDELFFKYLILESFHNDCRRFWGRRRKPSRRTLKYIYRLLEIYDRKKND